MLGGGGGGGWWVTVVVDGDGGGWWWRVVVADGVSGVEWGFMVCMGVRSVKNERAAEEISESRVDVGLLQSVVGCSYLPPLFHHPYTPKHSAMASQKV